MSLTFSVGSFRFDVTPLPSDGPPAKKVKRRSPKHRSPKHRSPKKQSAQRSHQKPLHFNSIPFPFGQAFNIYPSHYPSLSLNIYLSMMTASVKQRQEFLESLSHPPFRQRQPAFRFPGMKSSGFWSPAMYRSIVNATHALLKIRTTFRKFLQCWRYRKMKLASEEDLVTCEKPIHPIYIVDWKSRTKYIFEASTLMRDITLRLLSHDGFFDTPQKPRNPYTNEPFTTGQVISAWNQLQRSAEPASWSFTAFANARYCLTRFSAEYKIPLQLHSLRTTMLDTSSIDQQERLHDFIQYQHENYGSPFYSHVYLHAIERYQDEELLQKWRTLCMQFYEAHIKYQHNQAFLNSIHTSIRKKCAPLVARPTRLVTLYKKDTQGPLPTNMINLFGQMNISQAVTSLLGGVDAEIDIVAEDVDILAIATLMSLHPPE